MYSSIESTTKVHNVLVSRCEKRGFGQGGSGGHDPSFRE
eukprot:CAMPEP_0185545272 /NCGR_PEP_ID=MMETSP1381-20130426/4648_1 /TAXON_ID=298111 /ORGANISM="Pavlova sp., Strain CCMP459" /LENGTH=38 /DNA_ID= /DNA_START= /DNA_END= /DNA_ORIENTATION=